ncbi:MAG: VOC family protein [Thermoanaerobaculia bacterium]
MEIRQFRVVLRAHDFDRTCSFYGETLALPRLQSWDRENGRGALYQAGTGVIEVLGRAHSDGSGRDERFDYQGPDQKLEIVLLVASAEKAYEEILFRNRNIPGGLRPDSDGTIVFGTHDPDGVRILFRG